MERWKNVVRWTLVGGLLVCACSDYDDDYAPVVSGGMDAAVDLDAAQMDAALDAASDAAGDAAVSPLLSVFVTSATSDTTNLGGLAAADARCQALASAVGAGNRVWRAFLSVERDPTRAGQPTSAFERIGDGPWYNAKGALVANDVASLLARTGDAALFLDERGNRINGQWIGSPTPNEHDILTGTLSDGGVAFGKTCADWGPDAGALDTAVVGHSDGLGPMQNAASPYNSWFSAHENQSCGNTRPRGGAGRIYCFAAD